MCMFSDLPAQSQNSAFELPHEGKQARYIGTIKAAMSLDTPSLFEQDIGALLEAEDALEYADDKVEQITESDCLS